MRIIHAITCLLPAGAEENTIATCNAQAARGHEVYLIYGRDVDLATLSMVGAKVCKIQIDSLLREIDPLKDLAALKVFVRVFWDIQPDVVHTHNSKAGFVGRLGARIARVPIILHGVHILPFLSVSKPKKYLFLAMEKMVAPFTDAFIAVSKGMRDANLAAGLGCEANNHVVYSGMNLTPFRTATAVAPPFKGPGRLIVIVASLEPRKRHSAFLKVFARLRSRHPDLHLALLGQGPLEEKLKQCSEALGVAEAVHFLGYRTDVEAWLAAATVCVLPSMREGLPRVVVQYVAAGRPVVVTRLPGLEEIVVDGKTGFIVDSGKVEDMEPPLDRLLSDPDLAARMAEKAAQHDVSRWSVARMEPEIERIMRPIAVSKGLAVGQSALAANEADDH